MAWATFLLTLISGFVAIKLFVLTNKRGRLKFLGLTLAAGIFTLMELFVFIKLMTQDPSFTSAANFIVEWGHILCLAFVLSSLAIFIRESKPVFAQFPMLYTGLPLLIVISYVLVQDTYALKSWLLSIYQGGAIIVSLLMYSVYTYRRSEYAVVLSGTVVFLITFLLFWYVPAVTDALPWIWKILVGVGMLVTIFGYEHTEEIMPATESV